MWSTEGRTLLHPRFLQGNMKETDHMEYLGTDVKRLKWILQKQDGGCGPQSLSQDTEKYHAAVNMVIS
jgi:hypothetical protein